MNEELPRERGDLDDQHKVKRKEIVANIKDKNDLADLYFVLSSEQGRRFIWNLLKMCGMLKLSYSGPSREQDTAFYEGQRNIANQIFTKIDKNFPKAYSMMYEEAKREAAATIE